MRIEQLTYLVEISKNTSLNQSSKNLHISYQGLSNAINSLERELGFQVLNRTPKGVTLTPKGQRLVQATSLFLQTLSSLQETTTSQVSSFNLPAEYTIHSTYSATYTIIPKLLSYLYEKFPKTVFHIKEHSAEKCSELLKSNKISFTLYDQCILNDKLLNNNILADLSFIPFETIEKCYAVVPIKYPIADLKTVSIYHLLKYPLIIQYETSPEYSLKRLIDHINTIPTKLIYESNWRIIQQMLLSNIGILLTIEVPSSFSQITSSGKLKVIPLSDSIIIQSGYLFHDVQMLSPYDSYILNDFIAYKNQ